jgi:Universal stress protein UspA and related nucleotide-binding proteins
MKNILVPTDFSACATYATDAAFLFAEQLGAKLHLLTCLNIPEDWSDYSIERKNRYPEAMQLVDNANQLFQKYISKAQQLGIEIETVVTGGGLYEAMEKQATATQTDFVIMGSHGASGKQEYFIGSNTQKAIRKLHIPLFIIKDPIEKLDFKQVIFASNFNAKEKMSFLRFLAFIKKFNPETIHLVAINTLGWFWQPPYVMRKAMENFKELVEDFNCETHFYDDFSVDAGVRHFAREIGADLITISNHQRSPIKRIFQGSNVEALVNHSELPVLSIDFQESNTMQQEEIFSTEQEGKEK